MQIMEAKYGKANRVWVMDRGMVSEDNLEFMRKTGARYLVGTPKSMLKKFEQQLLRSELGRGTTRRRCQTLPLTGRNGRDLCPVPVHRKKGERERHPESLCDPTGNQTGQTGPPGRRPARPGTNKKSSGGSGVC